MVGAAASIALINWRLRRLSLADLLKNLGFVSIQTGQLKAESHHCPAHHRVQRAFQLASRWMPKRFATCLIIACAMALERRNRGLSSVLLIGFKSDGHAKILGHAWLARPDLNCDASADGHIVTSAYILRASSGSPRV